MFLTAVKHALYKTNWSRVPMVVNIDHETRMSWTSTILWLSKDGVKDVPICFNSKDNLEREVNNIIHTMNEIDQKNTADKMIHYLQMREAERKMKN
jgi:hypothetical protein